MCNGEEGSFRVLVENEACGIVGHRCGKAVTVFFQGGWIVMQDGEVTQPNIICAAGSPQTGDTNMKCLTQTLAKLYSLS